MNGIPKGAFIRSYRQNSSFPVYYACNLISICYYSKIPFLLFFMCFWALHLRPSATSCSSGMSKVFVYDVIQNCDAYIGYEQNELLGYASHEDELFLIYEYAEHRAVADRLHEPISKGKKCPSEALTT